MHVRTEVLPPRKTTNPTRQSHRATQHLRALLVLNGNKRIHLGCIGIPISRKQAELVFFDIVRAKLTLNVSSAGLVQAFMDQLAAEVANHRPADKGTSGDERADIARAKESAVLALQRMRARSASGTEGIAADAGTNRLTTDDTRAQR